MCAGAEAEARIGQDGSFEYWPKNSLGVSLCQFLLVVPYCSSCTATSPPPPPPSHTPTWLSMVVYVLQEGRQDPSSCCSRAEPPYLQVSPAIWQAAKHTLVRKACSFWFDL